MMPTPRAYRLLGLLAVASAACSSFSAADATDAGDDGDSAVPDASPADSAVADARDGAVEDVVLDAPRADAAPRPPNANCAFADKTRAGMSFSLSPPNPGPGTSFQITVQEASTGFTNVELLYCTPDTPVAIRVQNAISLPGAPPFRWQFPTISLPAGTSEVAFRADPATTIYATTRITVQ